MQYTKKTSLVRLIWWSMRLAWSSNKKSRRRLRQRIWGSLAERWRSFVPDTKPGSDIAMGQAVWLGASLAARSLVRYPILPKPLTWRLTWLTRIVGKTNGKAIVSAYLSWKWLRDMAFSSPDPSRINDSKTS